MDRNQVYKMLVMPMMNADMEKVMETQKEVLLCCFTRVLFTCLLGTVSLLSPSAKL